MARLYDQDNPADTDHDRVVELASQLDAQAVLDLGCGTGLLTVRLAAPGRRVVGVDPDPFALQVARARPSTGVHWRHGDSRVLAGEGPFDLVALTANVAQHIPDPEWERTLADLAEVTVPGATLIFDSRDPARQAWRQWSDPGSSRQTAEGLLHESSQITELSPGRVLARFSNRYADLDREVVIEQEFWFRSLATLREQLQTAGFTVGQVWGDWAGSPVGPSTASLVITATRDRY